MKISSYRSSNKGFALGVTMVVVAVALTIAAGLAINRQMWGQMGEKQLHKVLTQTALDMDSLAMLSEVRQDLEGSGVVEITTTSTYFSPATARTTLVIGEDDSGGGGQVIYKTSAKVAIPPDSEDPDRTSFSIWPIPFFDTISGVDFKETTLGMWDPLRGVYARSSVFGVLTQSELEGDFRENKSEKPVRDEAGNWVSGSKLHAWVEVDTAKYHEVMVRNVPASAFTLLVPSISGVSETFLLGQWAGGSSTTTSIGRYYLDGKVAPSREGVTLKEPLLVSGGLDWGNETWEEDASWNVSTVAQGSGNYTQVSNPFSSDGRADFLKKRHSELGGLFATGEDRPIRLLRFGGAQAAVQGVPSYLVPDYTDGQYSVQSETDKNLVRRLWDRATIRVIREDEDSVIVDQISGGPFSEPMLALLATAFTVDDDTKQLVFTPEAVFGAGAGKTPLGVRSLEIFVAAGGVDTEATAIPLSSSDRSEYMVRVVLSNVDALGWSASGVSPEGYGGLTISSCHPILLDGGFNADGALVPAMVVAQNIGVSSAPGAAPTLRGVFITTGSQIGGAGNPLLGVFQGHPVSTPSSVIVRGSVLLWQRYAGGSRPLITGYTSLGAVLHPEALYLSGKSFPPGIPSLLDLRYGRELLQNYRIFSEDTTITEIPEES